MNREPEPLRLGSVEKGDYVHITWWPDGKQIVGIITRAGWNGIEMITPDQEKHTFFYQEDTFIAVIAKQKQYWFI
jgi:hypothetical protein